MKTTRRFFFVHEAFLSSTDLDEERLNFTLRDSSSLILVSFALLPMYTHARADPRSSCLLRAACSAQIPRYSANYHLFEITSLHCTLSALSLYHIDP